PQVMLPAMQAALFPRQHPYARPPTGTADSRARIRLADAQEFLHVHLRPDNVSLFVLGDVEEREVVDRLGESLPAAWIGDPAAPVRPTPARLPARPPDPPPAEGLRRLPAPVGAPEIWLGWTLPSRYQ